jgi:hypothetical protein
MTGLSILTHQSTIDAAMDYDVGVAARTRRHPGRLRAGCLIEWVEDAKMDIDILNRKIGALRFDSLRLEGGVYENCGWMVVCRFLISPTEESR